MFAYISKQGGMTENKGNFLVTSLNKLPVGKHPGGKFTTECHFHLLPFPPDFFLPPPPTLSLNWPLLPSQFSQSCTPPIFHHDDHWVDVMIVSVIGWTSKWAFFSWKMFAILVDICPHLPTYYFHNSH